MSILSSFLTAKLIPALEQAFLDHKPELQAALLGEVKELTDQIFNWVEEKTNLKAE